MRTFSLAAPSGVAINTFLRKHMKLYTVSQHLALCLVGWIAGCLSIVLFCNTHGYITVWPWLVLMTLAWLFWGYLVWPQKEKS